MKIKFECKTKDERQAVDDFMTWLCEQGEQDYWQFNELSGAELRSGFHLVFEYDFDKRFITAYITEASDS